MQTGERSHRGPLGSLEQPLGSRGCKHPCVSLACLSRIFFLSISCFLFFFSSSNCSLVGSDIKPRSFSCRESRAVLYLNSFRKKISLMKSVYKIPSEPHTPATHSLLYVSPQYFPPSYKLYVVVVSCLSPSRKKAF